MARRDPLIRNHQQGWSWRLAIVVGTKEVHGHIIQKEPGWYNKGRGSKFDEIRSHQVCQQMEKQTANIPYLQIHHQKVQGKNANWFHLRSTYQSTWRKKTYKKTILSTRPVLGTTTTKKENCHQMGRLTSCSIVFNRRYLFHAHVPAHPRLAIALRAFVISSWYCTLQLISSYIPQWPNEPIHASCCSQLPVLGIRYGIGHRSKYPSTSPPGLGKLRAGGGSRIMGGNQVTYLWWGTHGKCPEVIQRPLWVFQWTSKTGLPSPEFHVSTLCRLSCLFHHVSYIRWSI